MEKVRRLASIPLPRPVRLTGRGLAYVLLTTPAILAGVYLLGYRAVLDLPSWGSPGAERAWLPLIETVFFIAVWVGFLRKVKRERRLLAKGELALGRVMK